jgi:hypothetical protein
MPAPDSSTAIPSKTFSYALSHALPLPLPLPGVDSAAGTWKRKETTSAHGEIRGGDRGWLD